MMPEERARQTIDELLAGAGWDVQDYQQRNLRAKLGVAVREFPLKTGFADYLLFVNGRAVGAVEAKAVGITLSGVELQSQKYSQGLPDNLTTWVRPLPFLYESTGVETFFTNRRDPEPRARRVFAFHQPQTLLDWVQAVRTLRAGLQTMPDLITTRLWNAQIEAIQNLERSLSADRPRALIQMATGSGKTFTAVSFIYRLIKHAKATRVLFLVDRNNLGRQTLKEFQQYVTPDDGRKFTELYNVQHLADNALDPGAKVCITTIQRLYAMLNNQELPPEEEEDSLFDAEIDEKDPRIVRYNSRIPIEQFDVIVTDECHRSIYNVWRQVLEYFDGYLIGLTATPSKQTFGFFNQNLVMEYSRQRAVADGVNVDGDVFRIRTDLGQQGGQLKAQQIVDFRNRATREVRWAALDQDLAYAAPTLDRDVVAMDQIRTVIRTFRDALFTEMFPGRNIVPKTLIFAKNDNHAEDIVRIIREEFGKGNDFCQKITYRSTGVKPEQLISDFRTGYNPRIAVTVDMIATGTDIKPLEVLLFMRSVDSRVLFEQMVGRGTRVINPDDLLAVTPDATAKTRFIIVDAVGIVDSPKADTQSLERKPGLTFAQLLDALGNGSRDPDVLETMAGRLSRLDKRLTPASRYQLNTTLGCSLNHLINLLLDATDLDAILAQAKEDTQDDDPPEAALEDARDLLAERALELFYKPSVREALAHADGPGDQVIDHISRDKLLESGFNYVVGDRAADTVTSFAQFIADHRDEIAALQIIYNQPYGQQLVTLEQLQELADRLSQPPLSLAPDTVWEAYRQSGAITVTGAARDLTNLISLVRHVVNPSATIIPFPELVQIRYQAWLSQQEQQGHAFSADQRWWLDKIADYIGVNASIAPADLDLGEFQHRGGRVRAQQVLGPDWKQLLLEVNQSLAA